MTFRRGGGRGMGRGGRGRGLGSSGSCICPQCSRTVTHLPGVPCNQTKCPVCGISMMRQGGNQGFSASRQSVAPKNKLPVIDTEKCTGCGECMAQCLNGAITIQNQKAVIDYIKCKNCRICQDACPVNAIH